MNGKMTMQVNQETAVQAFQLWADKHFATPMLVTAVKQAPYPQTNFEISLEPAVSKGSTSVPLPPGDGPVARVGEWQQVMAVGAPAAQGAGVVLTQEALQGKCVNGNG
jgi:hypothetical protein